MFSRKSSSCCRRGSSAEKTRSLFHNAKERISSTLTLARIMTISSYICFLAILITGAVCGLVFRVPMYFVISGASGVIFCTVILWKPHDKNFQGTCITQVMDIILRGFEKELDGYGGIKDPIKRGMVIRKACEFALDKTSILLMQINMNEVQLRDIEKLYKLLTIEMNEPSGSQRP